LPEGGRVSLWGGWTISLPPATYERSGDGGWSAWSDDWAVDVHIIETAGDANGKPIPPQTMLSASNRGTPVSGPGWTGRVEVLVEEDRGREVYRVAGRLAAENTLMSCWVSYLRPEQQSFAESLLAGVAHE
jgi:hypothetical protein